MIKSEFFPYELHFKQPAGTSRGVYTTRKVWYVRLTDTETGKSGTGECAPLPNYEDVLHCHCLQVEKTGSIDYKSLRPYPSMLFGLETAFYHLHAGSLAFWDTPFSRGEEGITINGLIWMGSFDEMYARIREKMSAGFRCIKLKIGAIDFEKELQLLEFIRSHFDKDEIELRVDANGAFKPSDAMSRLEALSKFDLHSIEQPILDEELIGVNKESEKIRLLETIRPQYIILKPSLHGGIAGSEEWIRLAKERNIGYWITSALESNIGLNAIAQWTATQEHTFPQGLGTGQLFTDNIESPLCIKGERLWFDAEKDIT